jgi:hypothetical protein
LPAAISLAHHDPIAHRADAQARERHRLGKLPPQFLQRAHDAAPRHERGGQLLRGAQDDKVLEGEEHRVARAARRGHEAGSHERADDAARKAQQALDIANAILMHGRT